MDRLLQEGISTRSLRVAVVGLGYVGLPLATTFAEVGFHVTGIDIDQQKIERANRGESYIPGIESSRLQALIDTKRLHFTGNYAALEDVDAVSICVPTPLRKTRVTHVLMIGGNVRSAFRFATTRAAIEHRLYFAREQVVHVERPAQAVREDRLTLIV